MSKTIKFNLILDGCPVRNLEGVQEHFSIEDMLKYYRNGLLIKWLDVRGYREELEAVKAIDDPDNKDIIKKLIKIFGLEVEDIKIDESICSLSYLEEEKILYIEYKKDVLNKNQVITDYHAGYKALVLHIIENRNNMAILRADVLELEKKYYNLLLLDGCALFLCLLKEAPKAIFFMLSRKVFKNLWIVNNTQIYDKIKKILLPVVKIKEILGKDLTCIKRNTQAMWDPIEKPDVKVMVLNMAEGTFIKNAGQFSEKLPAADINGKFIILDGLEYQCNDASLELLYMEV